MDRAERPLALTLGDPAGIGPDITLAAWLAQRQEPIPAFLLLGDATVLEERAEALGLRVPIVTIAEPEAAEERFAEELPVLPVPVARPVTAGRPDAGGGTRDLCSRSSAPLASCGTERQPPSSPTPSPRRCFTAQAFPFLGIPSISPLLPRRKENHCIR